MYGYGGIAGTARHCSCVVCGKWFMITRGVRDNGDQVSSRVCRKCHIDKVKVLWVGSVLFNHSNLPVGEEIDSDVLDKKVCIERAAELLEKITKDDSDNSEDEGNVYWRTGITYGHEAQWEIVVKIEEDGYIHSGTKWYYEGNRVV